MPDVLLVDSTQYSPTTPLFADCLDPGDVFFDEARYLSPLDTSRAHKVFYRLLGRPVTARAMNEALLELARRTQPDVVLVVKGQFIRPETLRRIKKDTGATLVCVGMDDPWNAKVSSPDLLAAIPCYDLYCSVRRAVIPDLLKAGAKRAEYVMCGYHAFYFTPDYLRENRADVALIGGADEDRIPYADALRIPGVKLALYGGYWDRIERFRGYARGVVRGAEYLKVLWSTNIVVGLVRKANRDDHTLKTMELPACQAFTIFEDTITHRELFGGIPCTESIFFTSPRELAEKVRYYLAHGEERTEIAKAECDLIRKSGHTWRNRFNQIMALAQEIRDGTSNGVAANARRR